MARKEILRTPEQVDDYILFLKWPIDEVVITMTLTLLALMFGHALWGFILAMIINSRYKKIKRENGQMFIFDIIYKSGIRPITRAMVNPLIKKWGSN